MPVTSQTFSPAVVMRCANYNVLVLHEIERPSSAPWCGASYTSARPRLWCCSSALCSGGRAAGPWGRFPNCAMRGLELAVVRAREAHLRTSNPSPQRCVRGLCIDSPARIRPVHLAKKRGSAARASGDRRVSWPGKPEEARARTLADQALALGKGGSAGVDAAPRS